MRTLPGDAVASSGLTRSLVRHLLERAHLKSIGLGLLLVNVLGAKTSRLPARPASARDQMPELASNRKRTPHRTPAVDELALETLNFGDGVQTEADLAQSTANTSCSPGTPRRARRPTGCNA
jgi:hypothetical protein